MATIRQVATRAGVSIATVSAVLNRSAYVSPELTARVEEAARELCYTANAVARGLQKRKTGLIGMLVPDISEPVYGLMVQGVERALKSAGYSLLLGSTYNRPEEQSRYLQLLRSKQVDGMLVLLGFGPEDELEQAVMAGLPIVFIARQPNTIDGDVVIADNASGARRAVAELARKGHRRIALLVGPRNLAVCRDRIRGWKEGFNAAGIEIDEALLQEGDYSAESGERALENLMQLEDPPTAVVVAGFLMMTGCLRLCRERGIAVPEGLELMAWSDSPLLDIFEPTISSVVQPSQEMGERAAELMIRRIADKTLPPQRVELPVQVKMRNQSRYS